MDRHMRITIYGIYVHVEKKEDTRNEDINAGPGEDERWGNQNMQQYVWVGWGKYMREFFFFF